jgi:hypothetical protein
VLAWVNEISNALKNPRVHVYYKAYVAFSPVNHESKISNHAYPGVWFMDRNPK